MNLDESKRVFLQLLTDEKDREFARLVDQADGASEVASLIKGRFVQLYQRYGDELLPCVRKTFSPALWDTQGILINPELIPDISHDSLLVIADGSVKTIQDVKQHVHYYGNVDLTVRDGWAYVEDSKNEVTLDQKGLVCAHGHTKVHATGEGIVDLHQFAHAVVQDHVQVEAWGNSFVESRGGHTEIEAYANARFIVTDGSADILMYQHSRGVIQGEDNRGNTVQVDFKGEGLLYVEPTLRADCKVTGENDQRILWGSEMAIAPEDMIKIILPQYKADNWTIGSALSRPMPLEQLKQEVAVHSPFSKLPELQQALENAQNERQVANLVANYLPVAVKDGINGEFLRTHFTNGALLEYNIMVDFDSEYYYDQDDGRIFHIFGDQLIDPTHFNGKISAYEHTLLLQNSYRRGNINESANAIVFGRSELNANGNSKAVALDQGTIYGHGQAEVFLLNQSQASGTDRALINAFDKSAVVGFDHSKAILHAQSQMQVNGQCRVLALNESRVIVNDKAEVAFATYQQEHKPEIVLKSDNASLIGLNNLDEVIQYRAALKDDRTEANARSKNLGR